MGRGENGASLGLLFTPSRLTENIRSAANVAPNTSSLDERSTALKGGKEGRREGWKEEGKGGREGHMV